MQEVLNGQYGEHEDPTGRARLARRLARRPARRRRRGSRSTALLMGALGTTALVAAPIAGAVDASGAPVAHAVLKPDFSYFAGKTITIVAPGSVGGTAWTEATTMAPLVGSYLHATVNVLDIATGGSIPGQDYGAAAAPNGLTVGELLPQGTLVDDVTGVPNVNFSMQKVEMIGSPPAPESIFFVKQGTAPTNMVSFLKSKTIYNDIDLPTGISNVIVRVFFGAYNAPVKVLNGYANTGTQIAGFVRGDGQVMVASLTAAESEANSGQAIPILQATPPYKGSDLYSTLKKIPTIPEYAAAHPPTTPAGKAAMKELEAMVDSPFLSWFVPQGTPKQYTLALTDAFHSAMAQTAAKNGLLNAGLAPGWTGPVPSEAALKAQIKHASILARFMNYSAA